VYRVGADSLLNVCDNAPDTAVLGMPKLIRSETPGAPCSASIPTINLVTVANAGRAHGPSRMAEGINRLKHKHLVTTYK